VALLAEVIDVGDLISVIWTSFVAGIGVCIVFSIAIFGFARAVDMRREGNTAVAAIYWTLMLVAFSAVMVVVVFGVIVMTAK